MDREVEPREFVSARGAALSRAAWDRRRPRQKPYRSDRHFDWAGNVAWSPDGTRIVVRTRTRIAQVSAEDGSVIADHPHLNGWLICPAREG